jgi:hypothetical protein
VIRLLVTDAHGDGAYGTGQYAAGVFGVVMVVAGVGISTPSRLAQTSSGASGPMWPLDLARRGRSAAGPGGTATRARGQLTASRLGHARGLRGPARRQYSFLI